MPNIGDKIAVGAVDLSPVLENQWIADLATFGENSYIFNQPDKANELINKSNNLLFNYTASSVLLNGYADVLFTKLTGDTTSAFDGLTTMTVASNSEAALTLVVNSEAAMSVVVAS